MIDVQGVINDSGIQSSLDSLANATGKTQGEILRNRSNTLARYLAESTQPVYAPKMGNPDGGSLKARDIGRGAVARDVARVYLTPAKIYNELKNWSNAKVGAALARQFYKAIKNGDIGSAREILRRANSRSQHLEIILWDNGALHKRARNSRGQVSKSRKPVVTTDAKALKQYIKQKQKKVGFVKSAWFTASRQIKSGGSAAAWLSQPAPGTGTDKTNNTESPAIALTDRVDYASAAVRSKYEIAATAAFVRSLVKETDIVLAKLAAKEQARANSKN